MQYTEESFRKILEKNNGELPREIVLDLERRVEEKGLKGICGIPFPIIEVNGKIKMLDCTTLQYFFVPAEIERQYREEQQNEERKRKEQEYWNSPEGKAELAKRKEESEAFWNSFSIRAAYVSLVHSLRDSQDSRAKTLLEICTRGRKEYAERTKCSEHSMNAEIAGARAVFEYVEGECPSFYNQIQKYMKWFNSGKSQ